MALVIEELQTTVEEGSPTHLEVVANSQTSVLEVATSALTLNERRVSLESGVIGPQGPIGEAGPETFEIQATENIAAYVFVTANGKTVDSSNTAHFNRVIGITPVAVSSGFIVTVIGVGEVTNPLWNWTPNAKLFLSGMGLSETAPASGFSQLVAVARNDQTIIVRMEVPILL